MSDTVVISIAIAIAGAFNAVVVFATFWLQRGSSEGRAHADASQAALLAAKALAQAEKVAGELADHRAETADKIARVRTVAELQATGLVAAEERLAKSIDDMGKRFDNLSGRLDRWFEAHAAS